MPHCSGTAAYPTTLHKTFIATVPMNGQAQHLLLRAIGGHEGPPFG
ncbi:hypothetical protein RHECNPAF_2190056 [Rhizobium etli CNPAF512]|nr:hypothetical protein RHECNPAF_2190056 [Rhizobium etli CNPAF512]